MGHAELVERVGGVAHRLPVGLLPMMMPTSGFVIVPP